MARDGELIEFDGYVVHETDAAVLFHVDDVDEDIWFPRSVCELDISETSIRVPHWLARNKSLI